MRKGGIVLILLFCWHLTTLAVNYAFSNHISNQQGLSQSSVQSVLQDRNGFVWVATNDGLNRYDGYSFKTFNIPSFDTIGYQSNIINCIMESDQEHIWIGTQAAIYCYKPSIHQIVPYRINATAENKRGDRVIVNQIIQTSNKDIWAVTSNTIFKLSDNQVFEPIDVKMIDDVNDRVRFRVLINDDNKNIWLGSSAGLFKYSLTNNCFEQISTTKHIGVVDMINFRNNELLIVSSNKVLVFNAVDNKLLEQAITGKLSSNYFTSISRDQNNDFWIGSELNGVFLISGDLEKIKAVYSTQNKAIGSNHINVVFQDTFGHIWLGSNDKGLYLIDLSEKMMNKLDYGSSELPFGIKSMAPVNNVENKLWAGSYDKGVVLIDYDKKFSIVQVTMPLGNVPVALRNAQITSLLTVGKHLYVAADNFGLFKVETDGDRWKSSILVTGNCPFQLGKISQLTLGADHNIYFSSELRGACRYDVNTNKVECLIVNGFVDTVSEDAQKDKQNGYTDLVDISSIVCDHEGHIWFGSQGAGLFQMKFSENGYAPIIPIRDDTFSKIFINCLHRSKDLLWVGTQSNGVYAYIVPSETLIKPDFNEQLASKVIHSVISDTMGCVWMSTNKGITRYDAQTMTLSNFTGSNYLQGYEFFSNAVMLDKNGVLFFAGAGGINYFHPSEMQKKLDAPILVLSELRINNQPIEAGMVYNNRVVIDRPIELVDQIDLYYSDKVLGLAISPIHFSDPSGNVFYYKLEPFEKEWVRRDMSNRFISYNNLKGGTYTLRIKSQSSNGVMSDEKTITINVHPPLWQKVWFKILAYLSSFLLVALVFGIWYYNQRQRQHQIEHEKNMMQSLIDNIPDAIYFKDLMGRYTRVNIAQAKLMGLKDAKLAVGKTDFDFFDHAQEAFTTEQEIIKTGKPVINNLRRFKHLESIRYFSETKIALYEKDKKCVGTVCVSRDITDLKKTEEAMLESQSKFKALFDNAPLAIFRINSEQNIVEFNYRFRNMFGFSREDELGDLKTSDLLVDPELGNLIFETVLETKEVNAEINLKRKNGETFIANLTLALLEEGFQEVTIEGIIEDITQMAIARDEIIKAKDKAVEADKLKSLFLANMSHEFRTPMNAIVGFSNMLREESLTTEDRNYFIDVIQSNGNNLVSLIDSIVDFSKLEADQMSVSLGEFNINPLIETIIDHAEKSLISEGKTNIRVIKGNFSDAPVRILSDRHRLNQVFLHLVSNAIKFTDEGEIEIGYLLSSQTIKIYVRDSGIGIDKGKQEYIYQRFTKIEDKNRLYGGTGLGLTISKGLVELMGGTITVDSELNKGATFIVELPMRELSANKV